MTFSRLTVRSSTLVCLTMLALAGCGGGGGGSAQSAPAGNFTVSGTIVAAAGSAADSDVNDPAAPYAENNTVATAQMIPNPVTLGGYVNKPGFGAPGRSLALPGDTSDIYRITFAANQTITLAIADSAAGDLDLFLGDLNGNQLASSIGTGATESITVPGPGTFLLEVFAESGASNYTLVIGQQITAAPQSLESPNWDFVTGEVIVRFRDTPTSRLQAATRLATAHNMTVRAGARDRAMLMNFNPTSRTSSSATGAAPVLISSDNKRRAKWETLQAIKQLRRQPEVEYAEPNYIRRSTLVPTDQFYPLQWHYPLINLPQAWEITTGSNNVIVAVVDTGVLMSHPDLQGQLVTGFDFISDITNANDGNGIDNNPDDPGDSGVGGSSFHGTHVAGTVAAATDNNSGVTGTSWATRLMPLRVLGLNGGTSYDIRQAIRYATGLSNDSGQLPAQPADIINLSLGGEGFSQLEQDLITEVRNRGIIVLAAAGNNASSVPFYPASYNGVISVSAVDINKQRAPYSNFGAFVDVAAPGGNGTQDVNGDGNPDAVLSTGGNNSTGSLQLNYRFLQGTSMAVPHVAGVVALMKAINPGLTPPQLDNLLASGQMTEDLGTPGRDDEFGFGLIDAHAAVVAAQGGASPVPATLATSPTALNFGSQGNVAILSVSNAGGGNLTINTLTDDASWLTVAADSTDPTSGIGTYRVTTTRSGLLAGTYNATITITSSANPEQISVIMQVSAQSLISDAGFHYVTLVDKTGGQIVQQIGVAASNGAYPYTFTGVATGTYQIVAGTDLNNDGLICDGGESCGGYLTLDQLTPAVISADSSGLDFSTGYNVFINLTSDSSVTAQPLARIGNKQLAP